MAKIVRQPPSPSDQLDARALEYFLRDIYDQDKMANTAVIDLPSLAAGATTTVTISVDGALPNKGQTVEYGLPSTWNTSLQVSAFVSATATVTLAIRNPTGAAIDLPSGTYGVRVRP